jgi:hypothetical protein
MAAIDDFSKFVKIGHPVQEINMTHDFIWIDDNRL